MTRLAALAACLAASFYGRSLHAGDAPREAEPAVFAVVVGTSKSSRPEDKPLRYADDDAARFHELLSSVAERSTLLAVLDPETQKLFPEAARQAQIPTRATLSRVLEQTFAAIRAAEKQGKRTVLYFIYSGHGGVGSGGEGEIYLADGPFRRSELYRQIVAPSPARVNHIIIDACHAYFMVRRRGEGGGPSPVDYRAAVAAYLEDESLEKHANTGVFVATSGDSEVHEWSEFSGGVFGHEVRSGLVGGADADMDGAVTYAELAAFVGAANHKVQSPKARVEVLARAPRVNLQEPIFRPAAMRDAAFLYFDVEEAGRYWLEDARGVRYADLHPAVDLPVRVALLPGGSYFVRRDDLEAGLTASPGAEIHMRDVELRPRKTERRGGVADALRRGLFAEPFSRGFLAAYTDRHPVFGRVGGSVSTTIEPPTSPVLPWMFGGLAVAAAVTGGFFAYSAAAAKADGERILERGQQNSYQDYLDAKSRFEQHQVLSYVSFGVAVSAGAATVLLVLLRDDARPAPDAPVVSVAAGPDGAYAAVTGWW